MRFTILGPGHVAWQSRRERRWWLTGLAGGCLAVALCLPPLHGPDAAWWWTVASLALLVAGLGAAAAARTVVELSPGAVRLQRFRPWGNDERTAPRAAAIALRVRARIATVPHAHGVSRRMLYRVELAMRGGNLPPAIELRRLTDELAARRLAGDWARAAGLPFVDAVGDEIAVRTASASDLGGAAAPALPPGPPPRGIAVAGDGALLLAWLPRRSTRARSIACVGSSLLASATAVAFAPREIAGVALGLGVGVPLAVAAVILAAHRGRTHVAFERGVLHCEHRAFGCTLHRTRIAVADIEQVRLQSGVRAPHLYPGVAVVARDRVLVLGGGLEPEAQQWLRAWLQAQFGSGLPVAAT